MSNKDNEKKQIKWEVFIPAYTIVFLAAILALVKKDALVQKTNQFFFWSLNTFGWLFQWTTMLVVTLIAFLMFSKYGNIKLGGKNAKPKYKFSTWFAMALTGGVATGIVTWGVNEPIIYFGNVWGELDKLGIEAGTSEAAIFAMGRSFYHWTFIPYALYALAGLLVAYTYFNKRDKLNVATTLKPLFGKQAEKPLFSTIVNTISMLGLAIGLIGGLAMCITLVISGLNGVYGVESSLGLFIALGVFITVIFVFSTYIGMDKGLKVLGSVNAWFYYGLLILLFVAGPTLFILRIGTAGMAEWFHNLFCWGLDPIDIGGPALVQSWTLFDWAFWIGYAPVTGIFLAMISYGRTVREFLVVNWILPSIFGIVWFSIWGGSALDMQINGSVDLVAAVSQNGATAALWTFLENLPFNIGVVVIPLNILIILVSFITAADATLVNIGSMCIKDVPIGTEPPAKMKVIWGTTIGIISVVMAAFGGGVQGVDGVKAIAAAAGSIVLFIYILQVMSFIKVFFIDKVIGYKNPDKFIDIDPEEITDPDNLDLTNKS